MNVLFGAQVVVDSLILSKHLANLWLSRMNHNQNVIHNNYHHNTYDSYTVLTHNVAYNAVVRQTDFATGSNQPTTTKTQSSISALPVNGPGLEKI